MGRRIRPHRSSPAFCTVDLDGSGRQVGFVMIPHSPHEDAWGVTRVPVAVLGDAGRGPTVVIEAGNHGDEYEGQIAIGELIRELDPAALAGRLILLPAVNAPAAAAGRRTSPVDGKNFNRAFPGDPLGTITDQIAAFLVDEIFPRADAFIDLHSGGSSLMMIPSAIVEPAGGEELTARNIAAALAFDAPRTVVVSNLGDPRTATATACSAGLVTVGTELGGGGTVTPEALAICRRGVGRVLAHLGVLAEAVAEPPLGSQGGLLELPGANAYVFATMDGVFEPFHGLGRTVQAGEPAGRIHCPWDATRQPETVSYQADGILYGRRQPGRVAPGACCLVVARPRAP